MSYVDGFVLPLKADKVDAYRTIAEKAGEVWIEHGALGFYECLADDMNAEGCTAFPELINVKEGEVPVFSFILYESRAHRDEVNKKVMADPRIKDACMPDAMPFDCARMAYGGFKAIVQRTAA